MVAARAAVEAARAALAPHEAAVADLERQIKVVSRRTGPARLVEVSRLKRSLAAARNQVCLRVSAWNAGCMHGAWNAWPGLQWERDCVMAVFSIGIPFPCGELLGSDV